jgi:4-hydroxy-tetrahydrodipicolinate synthase
LNRVPHGAHTLLVTPFDDHGDVDLRSTTSLLDHIIENGAAGVIALGSTGEFFSLSVKERERFAEHVVAHVAGRVPVTVGVGAADLRTAVQLAQHAEHCGADQLLAQPPMYFDQGPRAQAEHFGGLAGSTGLPVMLYDGAGGVSVPVGLIGELAARFLNVRSAKIATLDPAKIRELVEAVPAVTPLVGDDTMLIDGLDAGASASATALGNIHPAPLKQLHDAHVAGDRAAAVRIYNALSPAVLATAVPAKSFIAKFKAVLASSGVIKSGHVRPPLRPVPEAELAQLLSRTRLLTPA